METTFIPGRIDRCPECDSAALHCRSFEFLVSRFIPVPEPKIKQRQDFGCGNRKLGALLRQFRNPGPVLTIRLRSSEVLIK